MRNQNLQEFAFYYCNPIYDTNICLNNILLLFFTDLNFDFYGKISINIKKQMYVLIYTEDSLSKSSSSCRCLPVNVLGICSNTFTYISPVTFGFLKLTKPSFGNLMTSLGWVPGFMST